MQIDEIKDLMAQFDASSLKEFSFKTSEEELTFSKNEHTGPAPVSSVMVSGPAPASVPATPQVELSTAPTVPDSLAQAFENAGPTSSLQAEGDVVESPLVGVVYLAPGPDKPAFVSVGDSVKKGQTLMIIEAMKVMNEIPAPRDGVVTEILVANEEVADFGKGLVRLK